MKSKNSISLSDSISTPNNNISINSSSIIGNITNNTIILLSADEKIKELKDIIKEKDSEINILKILSQKLLGKSCESSGQINLDNILKTSRNNLELLSKLKETENEKQELLTINDKLNDKLNNFYQNLAKIQNLVDEINNANITSKNESIENIVDNLNINQALNEINKLVNELIYENNNNVTISVGGISSKSNIRINEINNVKSREEYLELMSNNNKKSINKNSGGNNNNGKKFLNKFVNADK